MTWGTHYYTGWTGYAPLSTPSVGGLQPWARLLIWLGLIGIWVVASAALVQTPRRSGGRLVNSRQRVVLVAGVGAGLYVIGIWISTWNSVGYGVPRRVFSYIPGEPFRWQPWQLLLIWLGLTSVWVIAALWILRVRASAADSSSADG
jgi:hypothetical protein